MTKTNAFRRSICQLFAKKLAENDTMEYGWARKGSQLVVKMTLKKRLLHE